MLTLGPILTNRTAAQTLVAGLTQLAAGDLTVECAPLTQVDSAAIAVFLGWQRAAQTQHRQLVFHQPPAQLVSLANVYGVAHLLGLPVESAAA